MTMRLFLVGLKWELAKVWELEGIQEHHQEMKPGSSPLSGDPVISSNCLPARQCDELPEHRDGGSGRSRLTLQRGAEYPPFPKYSAVQELLR